MEIIKIKYAVLLLLLTNNLLAQQNDWNTIGLNEVLQKDSINKNGYTLLFYNKAVGFDSIVGQKMMTAFFEVYPKEATLYNPHTLQTVIFIIDPGYKGVAATSGNIVRFNPTYFAAHPNDIDVVTHEVMHIVQSYPNNAGPSWLTEGIADYVRYKLGIDNEGAGWSLTPFNNKQSFKDAYRITARFLVWVQEKKNPAVVKELDAALRLNGYQSALWQSLTGKTVEDLWKEYAANPKL